MEEWAEEAEEGEGTASAGGGMRALEEVCWCGGADVEAGRRSARTEAEQRERELRRAILSGILLKNENRVRLPI